MALKITTQIGTDKGITSEAYIRISDYQISKYGSANFRIEIYMAQADAAPDSGRYGSGAGVARNQQIGENLYAPMTKEVISIVKVKQLQPKEVDQEVPGEPDEDGNPTTRTIKQIISEEVEVDQEVKSIVPDMSQAEGIDIFAFGYGKLKAKLQELFGEENVVDC